MSMPATMRSTTSTASWRSAGWRFSARPAAGLRQIDLLPASAHSRPVGLESDHILFFITLYG